MTHRCHTRFAHIPALLFLCSIACCPKRLVQHHCLHACHALGSTCCLTHACIILHDTIFHPFHPARSFFAFPVGCLLSHSLPCLKSQLVRCLFTGEGCCLNNFVLKFCFPDFLFFWRDLWEILVLSISACFSLFFEFLDFFHFREFLVLVVFGSVLTAGLADNHPHLQTLRPVTSPSSHPTP